MARARKTKVTPAYEFSTEIEAITDIYEALKKLDGFARERVLAYVEKKLEADDVIASGKCDMTGKE